MAQLWMNARGNRCWEACRGLMSTFRASSLGLIFERVLLAIGLWVRWMGVVSVVWLYRVQWAMGLSVIMSVMSGGGMMSTLGAE